MKYTGNDPRKYTQNISKLEWKIIVVVYVVGTIWAAIVIIGITFLILATLIGINFN